MENNIDIIGQELFNKIRSRFQNLTLGNNEGIVTNNPSEARFFDFEYTENNNVLGNISVSLDENNLAVMYQQNFLEQENESTKKHWFNFLKELRLFAKKRLLNFDVRDITKSNLTKRDYKYLSNNSGDSNMTESKLYGTSKTSFQDIGSSRVQIKHSQPVNQELAAGRTQHIQNIYIETIEGERFKYPLKHLNGARAMARHIAEGGSMHDDFGKHIVELSQELNNLRKFKNYVNRSSVMAEGLSKYSDIVNDRIVTVKKTIENIQKPNHYGEILENFTVEEFELVPEDLAQNWIDQLTIKQFNEELQDVFPYIYKLISEKTKAQELGPDDIATEDSLAETNDTEVADVFSEFENWANGTVENALDQELDDGNAFAHAVRKAKMDGKKKGDKISHPDGDQPDIKIEKQIPITEFILSMYDRESGQFPKGETAILTAVEKDYGESYIDPAKQFIEAINQKFQEFHGYDTDKDNILYDEEDDVDEKLIDPKSKSDRKYFVIPNMDDYYDVQNDRRFAGHIEVADENSEVMVLPNSRFHKLKMMYGNKIKQVDPQFTQTYEDDVDESGLQYYIGKKKYGKDGMKALAKAGRDGANKQELGRLKDKYETEAADIMKLAGLG